MTPIGPAVRYAFFGLQLFGAFLSCLVVRSWEPLPVICALGGAGYGALTLATRRTSIADAYWMAFSVSALAAGFAQYYSTITFGSPVSTIDARTFLSIIARGGSEESIEQIHAIVNAPIAVFFWRKIRDLWVAFGGTFNPWLLVSFNGVAIGLAASTAAATAALLRHREEDADRAAWFFALSGFPALFGGLLLRDAFLVLAFGALLLLVVWGLQNPALWRLLVVGAGGAALYPIVWRLRGPAALMVPVLLLLAACIALIRRRRGPADAALAFVLVGALFALLVFAAEPMQVMGRVISDAGGTYQKYRLIEASSDSLGMRYYYSQPLFLRLLLGPVVLFVAPIPLWAYFKVEATEYALFKGWSGLFTVIAVPFIVATSARAFIGLRNGKAAQTGEAFLAASVAALSVSVILTSMETRHLAQFLVAIVVLAAVAPQREQPGRSFLVRFGWIWWSGVIVLHLLWVILKQF